MVEIVPYLASNTIYIHPYHMLSGCCFYDVHAWWDTNYICVCSGWENI